MLSSCYIFGASALQLYTPKHPRKISPRNLSSSKITIQNWGYPNPFEIIPCSIETLDGLWNMVMNAIFENLKINASATATRLSRWKIIFGVSGFFLFLLASKFKHVSMQGWMQRLRLYSFWEFALQHSRHASSKEDELTHHYRPAQSPSSTWPSRCHLAQATFSRHIFCSQTACDSSTQGPSWSERTRGPGQAWR